MLFSVEQAFVGREEIRAPLKTPAWEAIRSAVIKIPCILNSSKDSFIKPEKPSFVNLKKTKDSFEDSSQICVF